jgi:hypothetical protein
LRGRDKISDNYRKQVNEFLDNPSGRDFFSTLNQSELDGVWEEITAEMDIEEVWNAISSDLDVLMPVDSGSGFVVKTIASVLIILVATIPARKAITDTAINHQDIIIENKQSEEPAALVIKNSIEVSGSRDQAKADISPLSANSSNKVEGYYNLTRAQSTSSDLIHGKPLPLSNDVVSKVMTTTELADNSISISPYKIPDGWNNSPQPLNSDDPGKIKLSDNPDFDNLKIKDNSSISSFRLPSTERGRISGGLIILFKNTWLLNKETFNGFKSETLNTTEIVFFPDAGLSLNFSLNKTWSLQADAFIYSNTGQGYHDYIYGNYSRKTITLKYSTIALSVKYKFKGTGLYLPHSSINVLAGGYFSILQHANQEINKDLENIESLYEKTDFGVRLGGEFEFQISDQLSIAPGMIISLGIPDISKPGYLTRTHNGSAGFNISFYYHFY